MIISHKYKFIFIKTNKTAGTSIEIALSRFCGDKDIIARISHDEAIRQELGYRGPQNYIKPFSQYTLHNWKMFLREGKRLEYLKHDPAARVRALVGTGIWNNYYKFCFERNPWDRVISFFYFRQKKKRKHKTPDTISEFIRSGAMNRLKSRGIGNYTINGKIAVDKVYLYENLPEALEDIKTRLGLPENIVLPHAKGDLRKDRRHYRDVLSNEDRDRVSEIFADEIRLFGYKY